MRIRVVAATASVLLATIACSDDGDDTAPTTTAIDSTTLPQVSIVGPGRGEWEVAAPETVGLDGAVLDAMAEEAEADGSNCLLVVRDGRIAGEWYWHDTAPDSAQEVFSATKSVSSVLVGIAANDGDLAVDDSASTWISAWAGTPAEAVTVKNLLSNDSGRFWSFQSDYLDMVSAGDRTAFAIGLDQTDPPGTTWAYNNSAIQTLEQVLEAATGQPVPEFAEERLLDPLGMEDSELTTDPSGNGLTFMGLHSTCRDMARFGWMVVERGRWDGAEIVPATWIEESTGAPSQPLNASYGYLWWLNRRGPQASASSPIRLEEVAGSPEGQMVPGAPDDLVWAIGLGGQIVQVHAATRTVVVRLGPPELASTYGPNKTARLVVTGILPEP